jgi:hypothetical protein
MTWAQRLKRVFLIDVTICEHCGAAVKIIACGTGDLAPGPVTAGTRSPGRLGRSVRIITLTHLCFPPLG